MSIAQLTVFSSSAEDSSLESSFSVVVVLAVVETSCVVGTVAGSIAWVVAMIPSSSVHNKPAVELSAVVDEAASDVVDGTLVSAVGESGSNKALYEAVVVSSSCLTMTEIVTSSLGAWNGFVLKVGMVAGSVESNFIGARVDGVSTVDNSLMTKTGISTGNNGFGSSVVSGTSLELLKNTSSFERLISAKYSSTFFDGVTT